MKFGVVIFPGTSGGRDVSYALGEILGHEVKDIWHQSTDLAGCDCVILPGGSSYGDYLRAGAVAKLSPVVDSLKNYAQDGGKVVGIGNGFQILCEAGMLPGALLPNIGVLFLSKYVSVKAANSGSILTKECKQGQVLRMPIAHQSGRYFAEPAQLKRMRDEGRILLQYCDCEGDVTSDTNPNGSAENIAAIVNDKGNVAGMMPHPERAVEDVLGSTDGLYVLKSVVESLC